MGRGVRVVCEELGAHGDGSDALVAYLDDGTEINAWCIVDDAEKERADLERRLQRIYRAGLERAVEIVVEQRRFWGDDKLTHAHLEAVLRAELKEGK